MGGFTVAVCSVLPGALLLLTLSIPSSADKLELTSSLFEEDDACLQDQDGASCALSLRQLRGERRGEQTPSMATEPMKDDFDLEEELGINGPTATADSGANETHEELPRPPELVRVRANVGPQRDWGHWRPRPSPPPASRPSPPRPHPPPPPHQWATQPPPLTLPTHPPEPNAPVFTDETLLAESNAQLNTFYVYRAMDSKGYEPLNVNAANLAGVLWYLHHEVVIQAPRKFNIVRIARFKVQVRATAPLVRAGMNFGVRFAFDLGQATGPFVCGRGISADGFPQPEMCAGEFKQSYVNKIPPYTGPFEWQKYGYFVGCNNLGSYPFPVYKVDYPGAIWYSFPGPCPSKTFNQVDTFCELRDPGGFCGPGVTPTGAGNCTWTYEHAGEISVDELVNITDYWGFVKAGGKEYDPYTDKGVGFTFWNGLNNETANLERIAIAQSLFDSKYPNSTSESEIPAPSCDFDYKPFYAEFYLRDPNWGKCENAIPRSKCHQAVRWAMTEGIFKHPEWYLGLSKRSSFADFQRVLFQQGVGDCKRPC